MPALYVLCALTLFVTLWDRKAMPWAVLICSGVAFAALADQVMGYRSVLAYPVISAFVCIVSFKMMLNDHAPWKAGVHALAVIMLLLDGWLFWMSRLGVYVGVEYATITSVGLVAQLILIGHRGAWNGLGVFHRSRVGIRRVFRVGHSGRSGEAS